MGGVTVRPWSEFSSTLPEEEESVEDGIIQPPGRNVAEAMHELMGRAGCDLDPVYAGGDHGWEFTFSYKKRQLWCQVTRIDKYLAVIDENLLFGRLFRRLPHPAYLELLTSFADEMARDPRFQEVRWYTADEIHTDAPGTASPVLSAA